MPEVTAARIQEVHDDITDLIDRRYTLEQQRKEVAAEERRYKDEIAQIDELLLRYHEEHPEVDRVAGEIARVSWSEERVFSVAADDKPALMNFLIENDATYLMTWHLNNTATREYKALHGELPDVTPFVKKKVSCRKR